jgi:hypothetical protein
MAEQAKEAIGSAMAELKDALPLDIMKVPLESLAPAQALGRIALNGLYQLARIVEQPLDMDNLKQQRLIGDMALGANKLLQRHAQGERQHDMIGKLIAAIEAEEAEKAGLIVEQAPAQEK